MFGHAELMQASYQQSEPPFSFCFLLARFKHHLHAAPAVSEVFGINTSERRVSLALGSLDSIAVSFFVLVVIRVIL